MTIIECVRARVLRGARTFMIKIKAHTEENLSMKKPTPKPRTLDNYHLNVSSGHRAHNLKVYRVKR